jgi:DNA-binding transcriptional MerR regulator
LKVYSFRTNKEDKDIEDLLESLKEDKSQYIKNALRFYRDFGVKIAKIEAILEKLEHSGIQAQTPLQSPEHEPVTETSDDEKILLESLQDIFSL